jgi:NADPH:quinone reductase-like Zn-dependent oxidoreductase
MKAIICTKYGPAEVLQLQEVPKPVPADNQVLVKVVATTAHIGDTKIRGLKPGLGPVQDFFFKPMMRMILGFKGPRTKILGMELAGQVEAVGKTVKRFKVGDAVFAATANNFGAYAEYCCLPEDGLVALKPANLTFAEAAPMTNGALTALHYLRKASIQKGQKVLIYGASGSVGTYAVQLAKYYGAELTAVCSTANVALVQSLGADRVIDYTISDFSESNENYDVIFDAVGKIAPAKRTVRLSPGGVYFNVLDVSNKLNLVPSDLNLIRDLAEAGKIRTVIDRQYPLAQIAEAHRYVEKGHKKGNVVIIV